MNKPLACAALLLSCLTAGPALAQFDLTPYDNDNDKRLGRIEYRAAASSQLSQFDKNKDGRIARSELPFWAKAPGIRGRIDKLWLTFDASGDGTITADELKSRADVRFDHLDANKDGLVTQREIDDAK